jgi:signal peptidase II
VKPRLLGGVVAVCVVAIDQAAKWVVLAQSDELEGPARPLAPFLNLTLQWNRGISFSLFSRDSAPAQTALLAFTCAAIVLLSIWLSRTRTVLPAVALGLIVGGAAGNALDRFVHGAVVDYLDLHAFGRHFFVFNAADAAINVGVALLIVDLLFAPKMAVSS